MPDSQGISSDFKSKAENGNFPIETLPQQQQRPRLRLRGRVRPAGTGGAGEARRRQADQGDGDGRGEVGRATVAVAALREHQGVHALLLREDARRVHDAADDGHGRRGIRAAGPEEATRGGGGGGIDRADESAAHPDDGAALAQTGMLRVASYSSQELRTL